MGKRSADPIVRLERWDGEVSSDDPDANFKRDIALFSHVDPLDTFNALAASVGVPVGAVVRYALARWASAGSEALLSMGPSVVERMWETCESAEHRGSDDARLEAYESLREMLSWLRAPLAQNAEDAVHE
ncbi:MAG TPA: DUF6027 family protein [Acidimicrobiales bacterium]|jgi:hypothetical protein|nr:DUF6027 family protein [Acidimicrobiales bacterium]